MQILKAGKALLRDKQGGAAAQERFQAALSLSRKYADSLESCAGIPCALYRFLAPSSELCRPSLEHALAAVLAWPCTALGVGQADLIG